MALSADRKARLEGLCGKFRNRLIDILFKIQTGHPGGSLSATEIVTTLYFEKMKVDPKNPKWEDRDRFVMGKGHAAPMLYLNLAEKGFFPDSDLETLRQLDSHLQGHPCAKKTPGVELSTGPLGLGLSAALGMALGARLNRKDFITYVLLGDGEIQEGQVWEAAMAAAHLKLGNLVAILDNNKVQMCGITEEILSIGEPGGKFASFGWKVLRMDGHDIGQIIETLDAIPNDPLGTPTIIIADTIKGKGVSYMEGKAEWHGGAPSDEQLAQAVKELGGTTL